jgi:ATP-binding cassette, subfamily B, bacterial
VSLVDAQLTGRIRQAVTPLANWPRTLRLIWSAAPRLTGLWLALLVLQGVLPAAPVYLTRPLIDGFVAAVRAGGPWEAIQPLVLPAAFMAAALVLLEVLGIAVEYVRTAQAEHVQDHVSTIIHERSTEVDLAFYESAEYYDRLDRARGEAGGRALTMLESGGSLLRSGITLLSMAALLLPYGLWLPVAMLAGTAPALFVVARFNRRYHAWWAGTTADRRWAQYFDTVLTTGPVAAEMRLFDLAAHFRRAFLSKRARLRTERLHLLRRHSLTRLASSAAGLLVAGVAVAWMTWRALLGQVTLGDLALFMRAFQRGAALMRSLLSSAGQIYSSSLFLSDLYAYLGLSATVTDPHEAQPTPNTLRQGVRFMGVTFSYPGSSRPALEDFSLFLPAGKVVAVVGPNGAGKSTLIKLLCRFYDPTSGRIELDGIDLRQFRVRELRRAISVLFQFPVNYHATVSESIALGTRDETVASAAIEAAATSAGAHDFISRLPAGYDTLLGRHFADGTDLSGGEWQRIAMARAFLRQSPILALDEPTSFMDSWAEADWFDRFRTLARGRTALIITHRFSIAMRADLIHVMEAGHIVESGTHHELLAHGGLYARSWEAQMQAGEPAIVELPPDSAISRP